MAMEFASDATDPSLDARVRALINEGIYFAQMELRVDLRERWRLVENTPGRETVLVKLVLPEGTEDEVRTYLLSKGIDRTFIYPDAPPQ